MSLPGDLSGVYVFFGSLVYTSHLHLWDRILHKYPELKGLPYTDKDSIIGPFSKVIKVIIELKIV